MVESLVQHGADPAHVCENGFRNMESPVQVAARYGRRDLIPLFRSLGIEWPANAPSGPRTFMQAHLDGMHPGEYTTPPTPPPHCLPPSDDAAPAP